MGVSGSRRQHQRTVARLASSHENKAHPPQRSSTAFKYSACTPTKRASSSSTLDAEEFGQPPAGWPVDAAHRRRALLLSPWRFLSSLTVVLFLREGHPLKYEGAGLSLRCALRRTTGRETRNRAKHRGSFMVHQPPTCRRNVKLDRKSEPRIIHKRRRGKKEERKPTTTFGPLSKIVETDNSRRKSSTNCHGTD